MSSKDQQELKPAWVDESINEVKVNINDKARLRKLTSKEKEDSIKANEFASRLREQHSKVMG